MFLSKGFLQVEAAWCVGTEVFDDGAITFNLVHTYWCSEQRSCDARTRNLILLHHPSMLEDQHQRPSDRSPNRENTFERTQHLYDANVQSKNGVHSISGVPADRQYSRHEVPANIRSLDHPITSTPFRSMVRNKFDLLVPRRPDWTRRGHERREIASGEDSKRKITGSNFPNLISSLTSACNPKPLLTFRKMPFLTRNYQSFWKGIESSWRFDIVDIVRAAWSLPSTTSKEKEEMLKLHGDIREREALKEEQERLERERNEEERLERLLSSRAVDQPSSSQAGNSVALESATPSSQSRTLRGTSNPSKSQDGGDGQRMAGKGKEKE